MKLSLTIVAATLAILTPALAAAEQPDATPTLEEGLWLRAGLGLSSPSIHRENDAKGVDQSLSTESPAARISIGYAPARWVAFGLVADYAATKLTLESAGVKSETSLTTAFAGLGGRVYPFKTNGLSMGLAGGWAFAHVDDAQTSSLMTGPGFSLSLGLDSRIFQPKNAFGGDMGEDASSQLIGAEIHFDVAPSVQGDGFEGNTYTMGVLLVGTL